jgi:hypothetical protein
MPRRRVLTDAQVERLLALPVENRCWPVTGRWTELSLLPSSGRAEGTIN